MLLCLCPYPASSHAAAEAVSFCLGKLGEFKTGYCSKDASGVIIDAVMAAQVAGVMVDDLLPVLP